MNNDLQTGMAEATRLTLAGRLAEATAAIQRALGTVAAPDVDAAGARILLYGQDETQARRLLRSRGITGPVRIRNAAVRDLLLGPQAW